MDSPLTNPIRLIALGQSTGPLANPTLLFGLTAVVVLALASLGYVLGRNRSLALQAAGAEPHSTPDYYGLYAVVWMLLPAVMLSAVALLLNLTGLMRVPQLWIALAWVVPPLLALWPAVRSISAELKARNFVERHIYAVLLGAALISIFTTLGILLSVLFESIRFFQQVSFWEFVTGTTWNPGGAFLESAGRGGEQGTRSSFGAVPLFYGTLMITGIAMLVAVPIGLLAAIYMSEYASRRLRRAIKPALEILAGIPTVVYGFFAAITVAPLIVDLVDAVTGFLNARVLPVFGLAHDPQAPAIAFSASHEAALAPGVIMGVMIIPFMSSLCDDVISAVPQSLRRGALAMGATESETIKGVVLPAALPGIVSAFLLAVSRAVGETMIVVMAAGVSTNITVNPLEQVTTVTVHIVANLTGDLAYDNPQTLSAFSLGLVLLVITLGLNIVSAVVIRKFRQRYEQ